MTNVSANPQLTFAATLRHCRISTPMLMAIFAGVLTWPMDHLSAEPAIGNYTYEVFNASKKAYFQIELDFLSQVTRHDANVNLFNCRNPENYNRGIDPLPGLSELALDIAYLEAQLHYGGYTSDIWTVQVVAFQDKMISSFLNDPEIFASKYSLNFKQFASDLVTELSANQRTGQPGVVYFGECGAGEDLITFYTSPPGASLHIISKWNWLLCQNLNVNPDDMAQCAGWRQLAAPSTEPVVGLYNYQAVWPDGQHSKGSLPIRLPGPNERLIITPLGPAYR